MIRKMIATIVAFAIGMMMVFVGASTATATEPEPCEPTVEFVKTDWLTTAPEGDGWKVLESRVVIDDQESSGWVTTKPEGEGWYLVDTRIVTDKEAYDEQVLVSEAVPEVWANFSPNHNGGPFVGPPTYPQDARGTWHVHDKIPGGHVGPDGVYQRDPGGNGNGDWFYRQAGHEAVYETVHHDAETHVEYLYERVLTHKEYRYGRYETTGCPDVTSGVRREESSQKNQECGSHFAVVTTTVSLTPWTQVEGEDKEFGEPVVKTHTDREPVAVEPCQTHEPKTPVATPDTPNKSTAKAVSEVPTVVAAGLDAKKKSGDFDLEGFPIWAIIVVLVLAVGVFVVTRFLD